MMSNMHMIKAKQNTDSGRPYGGEASNERVARRRQQFLQAGLQLFGTVGYRAATVRALCKAAKLTDRYFYESFTGTEDLLVEVYLSCMQEMQLKLLTGMSDIAPDADIRVFIEVGLDAFFSAVEDAQLARVVWLEVLGVSPRVDQLYNAGIRNFANVVMPLLRNQYPQWIIEDEEAEILGIAMIGAISQSTMSWLLSDYLASRKTMVKATSHVFLGLVATIEAAKRHN